MSFDDMPNIMLRLAHRGARIGLDAAQAGIDLARAVVDLLDPDAASSDGNREDRFGRLLEGIETLTSLIDPDRPLGQALRPGGLVDRLFSPGSALDQLSLKDGLRDLIHEAVDIESLDHSVDELSRVAGQLNAAAAPLGRIASRVPKFLRKPLPYEQDQSMRPGAQLHDDPSQAGGAPRLGLANTAWHELGGQAQHGQTAHEEHENSHDLVNGTGSKG